MVEPFASISAIERCARAARRLSECHYPEGSEARKHWESVFYSARNPQGVSLATFQVSQNDKQIF